eukprot:Colp12_sorted_trinity150504_noHs@19088
MATDGPTNLYVGNLDPRINEHVLSEVFRTVGPIKGCKIIRDPTGVHPFPYGFVEFLDHPTALQAMQTLNGHRIFATEVKVNWASGPKQPAQQVMQPQQQPQDFGANGPFQIFVGDLSPEITEVNLRSAFAAYGMVSDAKVMYDPQSGNSRGYGFVTFVNKEDAERAVAEMNGRWLGNRAIRTGWGSRKQPGDITGNRRSNLTYEDVVQRTLPTNVTVYCGNLPQGTTEEELRGIFSAYGQIANIRMYADKNFAFIRYLSHQNAAMAIVLMTGKMLKDKQLKISWGKETHPAMFQPGPAPGAAAPGLFFQQPMQQADQFLYQQQLQQMYGQNAWVASPPAPLSRNSAHN